MHRTLFSLPLIAVLAACQTAAVQVEPGPGAAPAVAAPQPTPAEQWLYGSAEAEIMMRQGWNDIATYIEARAAAAPADTSVVLAPGATAQAPEFLACGDQPLAAVFDADETLIWNTGAQGAFRRMNMPFDPIIWGDWERTGAGKAVAVPGALDGLARIRAAGVEVIVNTNREAANADGNVATLAAAGVGEFVHGETLFLKGDTPGGSAKDGRRYAISENYCVIALVGDQLGDIADIFNDKALSPADRRAMSSAPAIETMWGNGWFMLPNPVYGPSIAGDMEDIFPADTFWEPSQAE